MSGQEYTMDAVDTDRGRLDLLEEAVRADSKRLSNLAQIALTPYKTIFSSHKSIDLPLEVTEDLAWLEGQNRQDLYSLVIDNIASDTWQKIVGSRDIILLEQLEVFHHLLYEKVHDESHREKLLSRAVSTCLDRNPLQPLAILTYLLDLNPKILLRKGANIQREFSAQLQSLQVELDKFLDAYPAAPLSLGYDLLSVQLPKLMAKTLLTSAGQVNFGLIPILKDKFAQGSLNFHRTLARRLDVLYTDPSVRAAIPTIKAPQSIHSRGAQLLQILDGLPPNWPVTDTQAQDAALTAFLSHIRQTPPNGCFAIVVCQAELESNPRGCLEDFRNLLSKGVLTRTADEALQEFPFLFTIQSSNNETPFEGVDPTTIPGIKEASLAMGIVNYREKILARKHLTTPIKLIENLANGNQALFARGKLAFEFCYRNGLLAMWHNAVASMSEGKMCSMIKSEILKAVLCAIDADYNGLGEHYAYLKKRLEDSVIAQLFKRMRIFYDPELKHSLAGNGGFVLYDQSTKEKSWTRIDSVDQFRSWFLELLLAARSEINEEEGSAILDRMVAGLKDCISSPKFIDRLLSSYMDQKIKDPSKNLDIFKHTPWITRTGNSTEMTLRVYHSRGCNLKSKLITSRNASDLLKRLSEFYEHRRHTNRPIPPFIPCRIEGLHAFNLIPLPEGVVDLPKARIRYKVSQSYQKRIVKQLESEVGSKGLSVLYEDKLYLHSFRERLLKAWNEAIPCEGDHSSRERVVDTLLIGGLSSRARQKILSNSIPIADSNWGSDSQDVYFYCFLNPLSKKIELWKMGRDLSNATALNPNIWIHQQPWEIFYQ